MRRRSYIVIEVLVSLMLFGVLLSVIFGIFSHYSFVNRTLALHLKQREEKTIARVVLQQIFTDTKSQISPSYFYIEETGFSNPNLIFTFDNATAGEEAFSDSTLARLGIIDNNLTLTLWPFEEINKNEPSSKMQQQILLHNVSKLEIKCFKAPIAEKPISQEKIEPTDEPPYGIWTSHWPQKYDEIPTLMKMTCDTETYYFLFPQAIDHVLYKRS